MLWRAGPTGPAFLVSPGFSAGPIEDDHDHALFVPGEFRGQLFKLTKFSGIGETWASWISGGLGRPRRQDAKFLHVWRNLASWGACSVKNQGCPDGRVWGRFAALSAGLCCPGIALRAIGRTRGARGGWRGRDDIAARVCG